jgi:ferredoxin-NADP reductase
VHYFGGPPPRHSSWLPASMTDVSDQDMLHRIAPDIARRDVYVCGPPPWMEAVRLALAEARVPADQIHSEDFGW